MELRAEQLLRIVVMETERLTRLVNQVLDFTKIDSGAYQWVRENLDLRFVHRCAGGHQAAVAEQNIAVRRRRRTAPLVFGDKDPPGAVVINLLSNAIKYCEQHRPRPSGASPKRVSATGSERQRTRHRARRARAHLRRFNSVQGPRKASPGTGLGLAICTERSLNITAGRIWVKANQWSGSSFLSR